MTIRGMTNEGQAYHARSDRRRGAGDLRARCGAFRLRSAGVHMPALRVVRSTALTPAKLPPRSEVRERGLSIYCRRCRTHYSADKGDYFAADPDAPMKCCGGTLVLARRVVTVEEVSSNG